jgi:transcriptional regulator with XRE-family HTH domain
MNIKEKIGNRIKNERVTRKLTRKELAALTDNLNVSRINNYERGERTPGPDEITQLAKALEVSPAFLMGLSDDREGQLSNNLVRIPLLTPNQVCNPELLTDEYFAELDRTLFIPINPKLMTKLSSQSYALKVIDESMLPEFRTNDILIINPDIIPTPSDFVVRVLNAQQFEIRKYKQSATFHELKEFELIALHDDWANSKVSGNPQETLDGVVVHLIRSIKN